MSKKKAPAKSAAIREKDQYNAFLQRFKTVCDRMAGKGFFEQLPLENLPRIYEQRLPPLKLEIAPGEFSAKEIKELETFFRVKMSGLAFKTLTGESLPLADYFRDGLLLIAYFKTLYRTQPDLEILPVLIGAYQTSSEWFLTAADAIMHFMNTMCIVFSDPLKRILVLDYSKTTLLGAKSYTNKIKVGYVRVIPSRIKLDGHFRDIFPLSWSGLQGNVEPVTVTPADIGFATEHDQPVQVFIQQHALTRLVERVSLAEGQLLYILEVLFRSKPTGLLYNNSQLVLLRAGRKKLGYLVTELIDHKLIIITFLFLTNNGTPEGHKLAELTRLQKMDKQYLGIDTLEGVNSLKLSENAALSKLFIEAGCADLLDLTVFNNFAEQRSLGIDTDTLLRYLENKSVYAAQVLLNLSRCYGLLSFVK